jgi:hypothetical protein
MAERYLSELRPTYRLIVDEPPPNGVKVILKTLHGGAVIGRYYEGGQFVAWCPLPSFTPEQKERLKQIYYYR